MTKETAFAPTPAAMTAENREATLLHLKSLGMPVGELGNVIVRDGADYVVVMNKEAIAMNQEVAAERPSITPTLEELAALPEINFETRRDNFTKAAIAFGLNYNATMATLHLMYAEFAPQELHYDIDTDGAMLEKVIASQKGGEHALTLMKLSAMLGAEK